MSTPVLPVVIQGPAVILRGTDRIYVEEDISVNYEMATWNPKAAGVGNLGDRKKSDKWTIKAKPAGMLTTAQMTQFFTFIQNTTNGVIGASLLSGTTLIHSIPENKIYTFERTGYTKLPDLMLGPGVTPIGEIEITAIGAASTLPSNAAYMKAIAGSATFGTAFDDTKIVSDIYTLSIGTRSTPYDAVGAQDHFKISFPMQVQEIPDAGVGIADIILMSLGVELEFAPNNLTQAQIDTLLAFQDTTVLLPGKPLGVEDLTLASDALGVVLKQMGAKGYGAILGPGKQQHKSLKYVNRRVITAGVGQALATITVH